MLPDATDYEALRHEFSWVIPKFYSIGEIYCDRWAASRPEDLALSYIDDRGAVFDFSFRELRNRSNWLANHFIATGVERIV